MQKSTQLDPIHIPGVRDKLHQLVSTGYALTDDGGLRQSPKQASNFRGF
jgi:hypothetical protein